jgi:hypothetical protein
MDVAMCLHTAVANPNPMPKASHNSSFVGGLIGVINPIDSFSSPDLLMSTSFLTSSSNQNGSFSNLNEPIEKERKRELTNKSIIEVISFDIK